MKALLVNPLDIYRRDYWCIPPISLGYVAKGLQKHNFKGDIFIVDLRREIVPPEEFPYFVKKRFGKVDFIGFQMFSTHLESVRKYIFFSKGLAPQPIFAVGGSHPSFEPEDCFLRIPYLDFAITAEAEEILIKLLNGEIPEKNICFRKNGELIKKPREFIKDLDFYDMPAWDLMSPDKYPLRPLGFFTKKKRVAPMIVTRGCPYNCAYCGATTASGNKIRKRSAENVIREMEFLKRNYKIEEIQFLDDNLTFDRNFAMELCKKLQEAKLRMYWSCPNGVRIDRLDEELVVQMEKAGCYAISVGIESGSERILKMMKRGGEAYKKDVIEKQINMIKKYTKIRITGFFILGFPGATYEDDIETIDFSLKLNIDHAAFGNFAPLPGTLEWERLKKQNKTPDPSSICIWKCSYIPQGRTKEELDMLKIKSFLKFYLRPQKLFGALSEIKSKEQFFMIAKRFLDNR